MDGGGGGGGGGKKAANFTRGFKGDTGVISLASLPTGRAEIMCIKTEAKMAAFLSSRFVFICLMERHFIRNKRRTIELPEPRKAKNTRKSRNT